MKRIQEWDTEFMRLESHTLFDILRTANYLDIPGLLETGSKKAAAMIKNGSFGGLSGLPDDIQIQIAEKLLPHAFLEAASEGLVPVTTAQMRHATICTNLIKSDEWFQAALEAEANPMLVAKDLNDPQYLVLSDLDHNGDFKYTLPYRNGILDYLQPGSYFQGEPTVFDGTIFNIWNAPFGKFGKLHSPVRFSAKTILFLSSAESHPKFIAAYIASNIDCLGSCQTKAWRLFDTAPDYEFSRRSSPENLQDALDFRKTMCAVRTRVS